MKTISGVLRDQIWQFIGAAVSIIFGALAIFAAYNIFFLERETKALQIVILANTSVVEIEQSIAQDIQVLYKNQPVANLSLVQLKIESTGNQPIRPEDYAKPIELVFPSQAQIVEASVIESSPSNLGITVQSHQNTATLSSILLNESDRAIIRFLLINMPIAYKDQPFEVDARIAGVKEITISGAIANLGAVEERIPKSIIAFLIFVIGPLVMGMVFSLRSARK